MKTDACNKDSVYVDIRAKTSHCFHIVFFKSHTFVKMNDKKKEFNADSYTSNTIPVITSLTKLTLYKIEKKLF